jgi:hypothetical protein
MAHRKVFVEGVAYRVVPELTTNTCKCCYFAGKDIKFCSSADTGAMACSGGNILIQDDDEVFARYAAKVLESQ